MNLQPLSAIAIIKCKDGTEHKVISCITGKLLETNPRLADNLDKLSIEGEGYIAVVLCKQENTDKIKANLISEADYKPSE